MVQITDAAVRTTDPVDVVAVFSKATSPANASALSAAEELTDNEKTAVLRTLITNAFSGASLYDASFEDGFRVGGTVSFEAKAIEKTSAGVLDSFTAKDEQGAVVARGTFASVGDPHLRFS